MPLRLGCQRRRFGSMSSQSRRCSCLIAVLTTVALAGLVLVAPQRADAAKQRARKQATSNAARAAIHAAAASSPTLGTCHTGSLPGGVELPRAGPGLHRLSAVRDRGTGFGSPRLVAYALNVAQRLAELPAHRGVALRVGNMSAQGGGNIRWSHSHAAGRDVDFPLFVLDGAGRPASPDTFVSLDGDGRGTYHRRHYRFDAPRTWNLVASLLTDQAVDVAQLYLSEPLTRQVLAAAAAAGAMCACGAV